MFCIFGGSGGGGGRNATFRYRCQPCRGQKVQAGDPGAERGGKGDNEHGVLGLVKWGLV